MSNKEMQDSTGSLANKSKQKSPMYDSQQAKSPLENSPYSAESENYRQVKSSRTTVTKRDTSRSPSYALTGKLMEASIQGSLSLNSIQMIRNILYVITISDIFLTILVLLFYIPQPSQMTSGLLYIPHLIKAVFGQRILLEQPRLNLQPEYINLEKCPNNDIIRQMRFQWNEFIKIGFEKLQNKINIYLLILTICILIDIQCVILELLFQGREGFETTSSFLSIMSIIQLAFDLMIFLAIPLLQMDNPTINLKEILLPLKNNSLYFIISYMNALFKKGNNAKHQYDEEDRLRENQSKNSSKRLLHKESHTPEKSPEKIRQKSGRQGEYDYTELKN